MKRGLTLLEVIIVCAIILLLAGIVMSVSASATARAKMATCASNLGQIGKALHLYAQDHDDRIPPVVTYVRNMQLEKGKPLVPSNGSPERWVRTLSPYAQSKDIFFCPADPLARTSVPRDSQFPFADNSSEFTSYETVRMPNDFLDARGVPQISLSAIASDRPYAGDFLFESAKTVSAQSVHGLRGNAVFYDGRVEGVDLRPLHQR